MTKQQVPPGVAATQACNLFGGEDCLSEASSAAQAIGTGAKAPLGPRPGANGFGSFCRNKRTSSCGGETLRSQCASLHERPWPTSTVSGTDN